MANEQNLIPFTKRTPEEHRELSRKGGIASGVARRQKKERQIALMNSIYGIRYTSSEIKRMAKEFKRSANRE